MQKELNLVPYHLREKQEREKKRQEFILKASLLGLTLAIGAGLLFLYKVSLEKRAENLKAQVFSKQTLLIEKEHLKEEINLLDQHLQKVESLKSASDPKTDDMIRELIGLMPPEFKISKLSYSNEVINLDGNSITLAAVEEFWANLRESEKFKQSHISNISNNNGFNFSCLIKLSKEEVKNEDGNANK